MKNKKLIKILMLLTLTMLPEIVFATDYIVCDTDKKFPKIFAEMTSTFMTIIKIAVPIILVISGMISFLKVTFSSKVEDEMKKAKTKLINSIVAAVVIFFIFSIVNFAVSLVAGANNKFMSCVNCFIDSDKCTVVTEKGEKICPGFMNDSTKYDKDCNPINTGTNNTNNTTNNTNNTPNNNGSTQSNQQTNINGETNQNIQKASNPKIENINGVTYASDDIFKRILIVNKTYSIPSNYEAMNPGNFDYCEICLTQDTLEAFNQMQADAKSIGLDLYIGSGFRSYNYQKQLYNNYVSTSGKNAADTFSARPGYSEHQTGLAIDICSKDLSSDKCITSKFDNTEHAKWLNQNAHKYGFIIRYPYGKNEITGYKYESWHLRYVGKEFAQRLYNNGNWITIEEYFGITSKYSN